MVGKKYGPALVLPLLMFTFGSMTLLTAAAHDFGGIFALRWFLGMAESAFFPLVIYYLTTFYRRGELARRLAIFYAASNIVSLCEKSRVAGAALLTQTPGERFLWAACLCHLPDYQHRIVPLALALHH